MREWFAEYLDTCNRHDLAAIRELIDPSVRRAHLPGGVESWIADLTDLFVGFPDWQWRRVQLVVEDDRIAAHLRGIGTHLGLFGGVFPSRWHANVAEFVIYRVVNGRVTEASSSADNRELLARLGRGEP